MTTYADYYNYNNNWIPHYNSDDIKHRCHNCARKFGDIINRNDLRIIVREF